MALTSGSTLTADTFGSDHDTLLHIYTGDAVSGFTAAAGQVQNDLHNASLATIPNVVRERFIILWWVTTAGPPATSC